MNGSESTVKVREQDSGVVATAVRGEPDVKDVPGPKIDPVKIAEIALTISRHFVGVTALSADHIEALVKESYQYVDEVYGVETAVLWAEGFKVPTAAVADDMELFCTLGYSLEALARLRLGGIQHTRLSADRIALCISDGNPELVRLHGLAAGMRVPLPQGFEPNGRFPRVKLRSLYLRAQTAVNKMLYALYEQKLAIILPREVVESSGVKYHTSAAHLDRAEGQSVGQAFV